VFNYDLPNIPESYVHRIGRTARAGADGVAISFCDHEERAYLRDIERLIRMTIPATDRSTGRRPAHSAPHQAQNRNGGRPHRGGHQQRGNGGGQSHGHGHSNGRPGNRGHRSHNGGNGHQARPSHNGSHNGHQHAAPRHEAPAGEPSPIGNVTFMQRPGAPRSTARR